MRDFCLRILERGDLQSKLTPPPGGCTPEDDSSISVERSVEHPMDRPARDPDLEMGANAPPLPRPGKLGDPEARATCLARFAHHELMAVELFAWALLRWPELPKSMRAGMLGILKDEQLHCRLYLERLRAHGSSLAEHPLSDYFWKHVPAIAASEAGPSAFLASVGLTLEQGNLDFAPLYRDAFREGGDEASAAVCERVHADEVGHVRFALRWLRTLAGVNAEDSSRDVELYERAVTYPLSAARAKGRRFDRRAREAAGFSDAFVEHFRTARSPQELRGTNAAQARSGR